MRTWSYNLQYRSGIRSVDHAQPAGLRHKASCRRVHQARGSDAIVCRNSPALLRVIPVSSSPADPVVLMDSAKNSTGRTTAEVLVCEQHGASDIDPDPEGGQFRRRDVLGGNGIVSSIGISDLPQPFTIARAVTTHDHYTFEQLR